MIIVPTSISPPVDRILLDRNKNQPGLHNEPQKSKAVHEHQVNESEMSLWLFMQRFSVTLLYNLGLLRKKDNKLNWKKKKSNNVMLFNTVKPRL